MGSPSSPRSGLATTESRALFRLANAAGNRCAESVRPNAVPTTNAMNIHGNFIVGPIDCVFASAFRVQFGCKRLGDVASRCRCTKAKFRHLLAQASCDWLPHLCGKRMWQSQFDSRNRRFDTLHQTFHFSEANSGSIGNTSPMSGGDRIQLVPFFRTAHRHGQGSILNRQLVRSCSDEWPCGKHVV